MSVIEVLVALMLVSIGMLGIAGSMAVALRTTNDVTARRNALRDAARRAALIQSSGCPTAPGTSVNTRTQVRERWTASLSGGFAIVTDSLDWPGMRGRSAMAIVSAVPC